MTITQSNNVFSVSSEMIQTSRPLDFEIYINSSGRKGYDRFVRIVKQGYRLQANELHELKKRFTNLYVLESQRNRFVKSFVSNHAAAIDTKTGVVRETIFKHLGEVFHDPQHLNSDVLCKTLEGCRESVDSLITVIKQEEVMDIQRLIAKLGSHDFYTLDHSINVAMYCLSFYKMIKPNATDTELMIAGLGGLLHDLGKTKLPTSLINNPNKLSEEEFAEIKRHPGWGKLLIEDPRHHVPNLANHIISKVIYQHHENYDGSGYPNNIQGENIHILARLTSFADFYDAITTKRTYHDPLDPEEALNLIRNSSGKKIDPKLFKIFSGHMCEHHHFHIDDGYERCVSINFDPCQPSIQI